MDVANDEQVSKQQQAEEMDTEQLDMKIKQHKEEQLPQVCSATLRYDQLWWEACSYLLLVLQQADAEVKELLPDKLSKKLRLNENSDEAEAEQVEAIECSITLLPFLSLPPSRSVLFDDSVTITIYADGRR